MLVEMMESTFIVSSSVVVVVFVFMMLFLRCVGSAFHLYSNNNDRFIIFLSILFNCYRFFHNHSQLCHNENSITNGFFDDGNKSRTKIGAYVGWDMIFVVVAQKVVGFLGAFVVHVGG